ncbi:hypothetical protein CRE_10420 [Caenorhabditis remanei]|uniref:NR LBD domain-containing protein n=1 Tax=Caenorhabditis remanei TaxID=31234 RepID=E3MQN7_CAERE|nr:hypothetical protein CRE_10420 [Caenorhabditis remanei]
MSSHEERQRKRSGEDITSDDVSLPKNVSTGGSNRLEQVKIVIEDELQPSDNSLFGKYLLHGSPINDDQAEFNELVYAYRVHQRMMQLSFSTIEQFLEEHNEGQKLRKWEPTDVKKLSEVELVGLLYWIEKQRPYKELPSEDKSALLMRYSVRKLSLDHFYSASKHPIHCDNREFVMNNYTFVPEDRTGFELPEDDAHQIEAKRGAFSRTFNRFWNNVIDRFVQLKITDAEIVFLHCMLLWSESNNSHVTEETVKKMEQRRDWATIRLCTWYKDHNLENPDLRLEKILLLLDEIEIVCDMHCQDFIVAKMYEFCDMSQFFYEKLCYAPCNTNIDNVDPDFFEKFRQYAKASPNEGSEADQRRRGEENLQQVDMDSVSLTLNPHLLPCVLAPLPDDNP